MNGGTDERLSSTISPRTREEVEDRRNAAEEDASMPHERAKSSEENLGVFLTEAMSVLSFDGLRSTVGALRGKTGQQNAQLVSTFVDAIAAADSLTALKFTAKQLKATASVLSESDLELLRGKYRERAETVSGCMCDA